MAVKRKKAVFAVLLVVLLLFNIGLALAVNDTGTESRSIGQSVKSWFGSAKAGDTGVGIYDSNKIFIDFLIFFVIFLSIATVSLSKFLGGAGRGPVIGLSVALAAALALAAIKAGMGVTFFIPFVKNALFFIIFIVIFLLLKKTGLQSNFWSLIASAIITYLLFNAGNIIFDKDMQFNIGNLFGIPTTSENLAQTKVELTAVNAEFAAFKEAVNNNYYYKKFRGNDSEIQYEEIVAAKRHYQEKLGLAQAANDAARAKNLQEIISIIEVHQQEWENYRNAQNQLTLQMDSLIKQGARTDDLARPTPPMISLSFSQTEQQKTENKFMLACKIIRPSSLQGDDIADIREIEYEFIWYKGDVSVESVPKQKYSRLTDGSATKDVEAREKQQWACHVRPYFAGLSGEEAASAVIIIGPEVSEQEKIQKGLEDAAKKQQEARQRQIEAQAAEAQKQYKKATDLLRKAKSILEQARADLAELKKKPDANQEQISKINANLAAIGNSIKAIEDKISVLEKKSEEGQAAIQRRESAAAALVSEAVKTAAEAEAKRAEEPQAAAQAAAKADALTEQVARLQPEKPAGTSAEDTKIAELVRKAKEKEEQAKDIDDLKEKAKLYEGSAELYKDAAALAEQLGCSQDEYTLRLQANRIKLLADKAGEVKPVEEVQAKIEEYIKNAESAEKAALAADDLNEKSRFYRISADSYKKAAELAPENKKQEYNNKEKEMRKKAEEAAEKAEKIPEELPVIEITKDNIAQFDANKLQGYEEGQQIRAAGIIYTYKKRILRWEDQGKNQYAIDSLLNKIKADLEIPPPKIEEVKTEAKAIKKIAETNSASLAEMSDKALEENIKQHREILTKDYGMFYARLTLTDINKKMQEIEIRKKDNVGWFLVKSTVLFGEEAALVPFGQATEERVGSALKNLGLDTPENIQKVMAAIKAEPEQQETADKEAQRRKAERIEEEAKAAENKGDLTKAAEAAKEAEEVRAEAGLPPPEKIEEEIEITLGNFLEFDEKKLAAMKIGSKIIAAGITYTKTDRANWEGSDNKSYGPISILQEIKKDLEKKRAEEIEPIQKAVSMLEEAYKKTNVLAEQAKELKKKADEAEKKEEKLSNLNEAESKIQEAIDELEKNTEEATKIVTYKQIEDTPRLMELAEQGVKLLTDYEIILKSIQDVITDLEKIPEKPAEEIAPDVAALLARADNAVKEAENYISQASPKKTVQEKLSLYNRAFNTLTPLREEIISQRNALEPGQETEKTRLTAALESINLMLNLLKTKILELGGEVPKLVIIIDTGKAPTERSYESAKSYLDYLLQQRKKAQSAAAP